MRLRRRARHFRFARHSARRNVKHVLLREALALRLTVKALQMLLVVVSRSAGVLVRCLVGDELDPAIRRVS
jgi:hypothetical protein